MPSSAIREFAIAIASLLFCGGLLFAEIQINEFDATGSENFLDADGDRSDWIELKNTSAVPVPLAGYFLTDDATNLNKWSLPAIEIAAESAMVIFASGKDRAVAAAELHTNFSLSRSGEFLALVAADGTTIVDEFSPSYPEQTAGLSYGRSTSGTFGFFYPPTPGANNGDFAFAGIVADTQFSVDRGFYDEPFQVSITCATEGAQIRFTTDGSKPSESHGAPYTEPIPIATTTVLRAIAYKTDFRPSNVDTHTYLFLNHVLQQPTNPSGFPSNWNSSLEGTQPSEYQMDPEVVGTIYSEEEVKGGLRSLPTVCLTTAVDDLFGSDTGIYINAKQRGDAWEREISMEFFDFGHGRDLQVDTGLRMNGNFSRSKIQPKHNMRVVFREEYGPSRLDFELFEGGKVTRFNSLILRGLSGDSWAHARYPHAQYIRDQWFRDAHEQMGYEGIHQREIQLYINGLYWGMYHIFERVEDDSMAERFGGVEEDWEVIKDGSNNSVLPIDGGSVRWDALLDIIQAGGLSATAPYAALQEYLDLDAFIDYMLLNFYGGNDDWCSKNYRAAVRLNPPGRYMFFPHDTERAGYNALSGAGLNKNNTNKNDIYRPTYVHQQLITNAEYRLRFADRIQRYLFNDGALTDGPAGALWSGKADQIREAMKAECARWGDYAQEHRGASKINTLAEWQVLVDREMTTWFPQRSAIVVEQLRSRSLYPDIEAPVFNQHGGNVPEGFNLLFTNLGSDDVYYTTDGSDPRLPGGAVSPGAGNAASGNVSVTMIDDNSPGWEFLDDGSDQGSSDIVDGHPSYGAGNWKHPDFAPATAWVSGTARLGYSANENTLVGWGPVRADKFPTTYFRKSFDLTDASLVSNLLLEVERDDGAIVYLNGTEVARDGVAAGAVEFDTLASESAGGEEETTFYPFAIGTNALLEGRNVLGIEVHQFTVASSDMSIDARLSGTKIASDASILINGQTVIKARAYNAATQTWSALTEASFTTGRPPLAGDLTVSEIHYNPAPPDADELAQSFITSASDFEFVEIMNISPDTLDLSGTIFTEGIDFTFPPSTPLLAASERILIVNNRAAFEFRYSVNRPLVIAGEFGSTSGLANGGEQIALHSVEVSLIDFSYDDSAPWPEAADGSGYSLVLIRPSTKPDLSDAINWRSSAAIGGVPGGTDATTLTEFAATNNITDPFADHDYDGIATIIEYATGTPFDSPSHERPLTAWVEPFSSGATTTRHTVLEFSLGAGADDIELNPESSADLSSWIETRSFIYLGETRLPGGQTIRRFRSNLAFQSELAQFFRLRAEQR
ncbi:MAG: hypothetical protein ACI9NC_000368 [Verrucomicrobiales bacterium]|jgi:hypothetical protein